MNLVVDGLIYDVKNYLNIHPGGKLPILHLLDTDVSDAFDNFHLYSGMNLQ
jgi:cytochrome b involved in lipid metabolism